MPLPAEARLFCVVPAAGVGRRMGADCPKQYLRVDGRTIAEHTLMRLLEMAEIARIVVAIGAQDPWWPTLDVARDARIETVAGGDTRARSVLNALEALVAGGASPADRVLVHDVARPCVRIADVRRLVAESGDRGGLLAVPVVDTIKLADADGEADARVARTLDRARIWRALTPQLFPLVALRDALRDGLARDVAITDEASAMEAAGWRPTLVPGSADNIKLTVPEDLALVAFHLARQRDGA